MFRYRNQSVVFGAKTTQQEECMNLRARLEGIDIAKVADFEEEVGDNDVVFGTMGEDLRRIAGLSQILVSEARAIAAELDVLESEHATLHRQGSVAQKCCAEHARRVWRIQHDRLGPAIERTRAIKEIFWNTVRIDFPDLLEKEVIGARKGFKLVWVRSGQQSTGGIVTLIAHIIGRGRR